MTDCEDRQTMPDDPTCRLMRAIFIGDLETATNLLNSLSPSHWSTAWLEGYNLLCEALKHGQDDIAKLLLIRGAKVNNNNSKQFSKTPLHFAVLSGSIEMVDMLLERETNADAQDDSEDTPIHIAIKNGNDEIFKSLLKKVTNLEVKSCGMTSLHIAANLGRNMMIKALLDRNANINSTCTRRRKYGYTPLHFAVACGNESTVMLLLTKGANINVNTILGGLTPLHLAIKMNHYKIAKVLLEHGTNVDSRDINGKTILHYAVKNRQFKMVELVLDHGANVNATDKSNITPLHLCAMNFDNMTMKILLARGATINATSDNGKTPLHLAVKKDDEKCVELLVKNGADIGYANKEGHNSLHIAARSYTKNVMHVLLDYFDGIDNRDKFGRTALHMASMNRDARNVTTLLNHNADVNIVCEDGYDAFNYINRGRAYYASDDGTDFFLVIYAFQHHIDKLITLGRYVSKENLEVADRNILICGSERPTLDVCKKEVDVMRKTKIGDSNVNFYDLLTKDMNQLAINMRNKIIVDTLTTGDYKEKFDLYKEMIHNRFKKCLKRERLLDPSIKSLSSLIGHTLDLFTIAELLSYLSNADLENIIIADQTESGDNEQRLR